MFDRTYRWYIEGGLTRTKTEVGGTYTTDCELAPDSAKLTLRIAGKGSPVTVDITANDASIFNEDAALPEGIKDYVWDTVEPDPLPEGTVLRLDITGVSEQTTAQDLTVELRMRKTD